MINVRVYKQSNYPISSPKIKRALKDFLKKKGISSDAEVSIAIVGEEKMKELGKRYLKEGDKPPHNVLSFTADEVKEKFVEVPDNVIRLGEIVICYPRVREDTNIEGKLIDEKAIELIEHGALHLLGIHHP